MTARRRTDCEGFHRRDFLQIGAAGLLGLSLPELLRLEARAGEKGEKQRRADSVIMIWLAGGPAHLDIWDLKPEAPEGIRGEFKPIDSSVPGVRVCEHLPKMARAADKVTIVRSLQHTLPAHGPAALWMTTGNSPIGSLTYPSLGSLASHLLPVRADVPAYVAVGGKGAAAYAGFLGATHNPFIVEGLSNGKSGQVDLKARVQVRGTVLPTGFTLEQLEDRASLLRGFDHGLEALEQAPGLGDGLDAFHQKALSLLRSEKTRKAFALEDEKPATRERYGLTSFGQGALMARRLVEAGVHFVTIGLGGWDTHQKNFEALSKTLLPALDQTLSALVEDLSERGLSERTVVYCAGEFGRTPKINTNAGRDHWARSMAVVLAGGGFKRGHVHGSTDAQGMAAATEPCTPDDVSATLFHCLGLDPHQELKTSTGRPIQLFREGKVIDKLLA
jgi:uncharacterized protein (DUF1501 family)